MTAYRLTAAGESSRLVAANSEREALSTLGLPVIRNLNGRLMAVNPSSLFTDEGIWTATEED